MPIGYNSSMSHAQSIAIVGAGLVGASIALAAAARHRVAILEKHLPDFTQITAEDGRPISLNYGSHLILKSLGVWDALSPYSSPIREVHVSERGKFGALRFSADEMKVPALGYVVPYLRLHKALYEAAASHSNVTFIPVDAIQTVSSMENHSTLIYKHLDKTHELRSDVLIAADGTDSTIRALLNIKVEEQDHHEIALIARIKLASPHNNIAQERFTVEGALAILPLYEKTECRLVWTMPSGVYEKVSSWDNDYFKQHISNCFSRRLGKIESIEITAKFPLRTSIAQEQIVGSTILVGNAAHTIYPLAAQGFNLGLRDAMALIEVLKRGLPLSEYSERREKDQRRTIALTNGISQLFGLQLPLLSKARALGLLAVDMLPPLKRALARQMMGVS